MSDINFNKGLLLDFFKACKGGVIGSVYHMLNSFPKVLDIYIKGFDNNHAIDGIETSMVIDERYNTIIRILNEDDKEFIIDFITNNGRLTKIHGKTTMETLFVKIYTLKLAIIYKGMTAQTI